MGQTVARTDSIRLKLAPDMHARLEKYAQSYGMPLSTLGAFALADWVNKQDLNASMTRMAVLEATRTGFAHAFNDEAMERAMAAALPSVVLALADAGHIDAEKVGGSALPEGPGGAQAGSGSSAVPQAAASAECAVGASPEDRARNAT